MRVMSDVREAAWGVVQGGISELDFDFERYAREHFERLQRGVPSADFEDGSLPRGVRRDGATA